MRTTRTYVIMDVSLSTFEEVKRKLLEAGYDHAICKGNQVHLDMHGIALREDGQFAEEELTKNVLRTTSET